MFFVRFLFAVVFSLGSLAHAQTLQIIAPLAGSSAVSYGSGLSANGQIVVGQSNVQAFRWTQSGGTQGLGFLSGGNVSSANNISADGTVVVGQSNAQAFSWTAGAGMQGLGFLPSGSYSSALDVSADGSVIVGLADNSAGNPVAFRWTPTGQMQSLGFLSGGTSSVANAVSNDGTVIVGYSENSAINNEAFRWTQSTGTMQGLGFLGGSTSVAENVSADGTVVIGYSQNANNQNEAFKWTENTGTMQGLGFLSGYNASLAKVISFDNSTIFGLAQNGGNNTLFRWRADTGMQSFENVLTNAGVNLAGWSFVNSATNIAGVSDNGDIVLGTANFNGTPQTFVATANGLTTPQAFEQALQPLGLATSFARSATVGQVGQTMQFTQHAFAQNSAANPPINSYAPQAFNKNSSVNFLKPQRAIYAFGQAGVDADNYQAGVNTGFLQKITPSINLGLGVHNQYNRQNTQFNGHSSLAALGLSVMGAYEPAQLPWRIYAATSLSHLELNQNRHYLNGANVDGSKGDTQGFGMAGNLTVGYEKTLDYATKMMPFMGLDVAHTNFDAYTEKGGAFAANVAKQHQNYVASRLGAQLSHQLTANKKIIARAAWGHKYSTDSAIAATTAGLAQSVAVGGNGRNWAELGAGFQYQWSDSTSFRADVASQVGNTATPNIVTNVGVVWQF
jgi:probable HAF family extracellular repeat protein